MDDAHFDDLTRSFAVPSRRSVLSALGAALVAALFGSGAPGETRAKRKKRRNTKTVRRNERDRVRAAKKKGNKKGNKKKNKDGDSAPSPPPPPVDTLSPPPPPPPPPVPPPLPEACALAFEMLGLVNAWRAQNGVAALTLDAELIAAAVTKSAAMASAGLLDHVIGGVDARQNLTNHGYPVDTATAENIAGGTNTVAGTFAAWENSSLHNTIMLNPAFLAMGVAAAQAVGKQYPDYWAQTFGSLVENPVTSC